MRRNWFIAAIVLGILAIVFAAVAMRLSDDGDTQSTAEWADSVCTSLGDWRDSIVAVADVSGEPLTADTLGDRLDEGRQATSTLVSELQALGPPDLDAGEDVEHALDDAVAGLEESYDDVQSAAADAVDASDQTEFLEALAGLADDFQALLGQVGDIVATLQSASLFGDASAELQQGFADSESCQALPVDS